MSSKNTSGTVGCPSYRVVSLEPPCSITQVQSQVCPTLLRGHRQGRSRPLQQRYERSRRTSAIQEQTPQNTYQRARRPRPSMQTKKIQNPMKNPPSLHRAPVPVAVVDAAATARPTLNTAFVATQITASTIHRRAWSHTSSPPLIWSPLICMLVT
jgi:hypothetical protein